MSVLTVTSEGQLPLSQEVLGHLGISPGETVELAMLPGGRIALRSRRTGKPIDRLFGMLANKTGKVATLAEIQSACEAGWAGLVELD